MKYVLPQTACQEFQSSARHCRSLAGSQGDNLELRDLFAGRVSNVINPLLKYCLYELQENGGDISEFEDGEKDLVRESGTATSTITFRGRNVVLQSAALKVLFLKMASLENDYIASQVDSHFVALFTAYDDANTMISADLRKLRDMKAGPAVDAKKLDMEFLLGYVKNAKLKLSMKRHESRITSSEKESELAHLYDSLLQDCKSVRELPGPAEEDEFLLEANANVLRVRAFRAYYVSQLYMQTNKVGEALALLNQARVLANQAMEEIAACEQMEGSEDYLDELEKLLSEDIKGSTIRARTQMVLGTVNSTEGALLSNLDSFAQFDNCVDLQTIPVPCKPVFFDIAWDHVSSIPTDDLQGHIDKLKPSKSGGLLGWLSGS